MNLPTLIGILIIVAVVAAIVAKGVWNKKHHKGGCGCGCDHCPNGGACHTK
ncbi:FeoB-associated Cys-rich membrane protein [Caproicibacterium sp. XB2]|mgnify:FL=1|jgi:hypothetical protein|uniref:FeoB-associated Cys-rich membrane protein n=1 Tax=Caproicibacterium sp. XB2 TaxID=3388458 RepID=UPI000A28E20A|nr:hypothetical protein B6259_07095 [Ruminococcaceae bacterium CPB6]